MACEAAAVSRSATVCIFYEKGKCRRGDRCPFKHCKRIETSPTFLPFPSAPPPLSPRAQAAQAQENFDCSDNELVSSFGCGTPRTKCSDMVGGDSSAETAASVDFDRCTSRRSSQNSSKSDDGQASLHNYDHTEVFIPHVPLFDWPMATFSAGRMELRPMTPETSEYWANLLTQAQPDLYED